MADISDDTELDAEDGELKPWERPFDVRPGGLGGRTRSQRHGARG